MSIASDNRSKYLKPPTFEEIDIFRQSLGVSVAQFERFYGIPSDVIGKVKKGDRNLPAKFWHIIYKKIVPAYGSGFLNKKKKQTKHRTKKTINKPSSAIMDKLKLLK